ncbi:MAG: tRNA (5-methylaminomethyl-2-thiouridine)(34)-methyltransferase MnmD, partial [Bacteroidota bacterium]
ERKDIHILEVGFGTGLNALLTILESRNSGKQVKYTAIEKYPLPLETVKQLNYEEQLSDASAEELLKLHEAAWGEWQELPGQFLIRKQKTDLSIYQPDENFDLVYFDAFAPDKQPDMWSEDILKKMYACLSHGGILVTYSAKGLIKRRLKTIGFQVESLPGPPGKREMIRAIKE